MGVFFPVGANRRASIPPFVWWLCLISGAVTCIYGLSHSTSPSFAPRITAVGNASDCVEDGPRGSTRFAFRFLPEGGSPVKIETRIIMPHWGNADLFNERTLRIVYLNDTTRSPSNEAIDIEILNGDNAGWRDSLDARPFGIWLAIPVGAAFAGFGYLGLRYRKSDTEQAEPSEVTT